MKEKCAVLLDKLREELAEIELEHPPGLKKMVAGLGPVRKAFGILREWVVNDGLASVEEEIDFFKYWKPAFYALQIFAVELGAIEDQLPVADLALRAVYIREQLVFIERFFRQQAFLYQYYKMDATELDKLYFVRGVAPLDMLALELPGNDPVFSTTCDYVFAKFMAYEKLRNHLLDLLSVKEGGGESFVSKKGKVLKWTGDTCNLIEVAYGIYDTLQINEGDVDLTDIIDWLESTLNVNLSRFYRRFMEIKRRKVMSKTKYLDEMRTAVNKRIDDTDALQSEKRKSFRNH